MQLRDLVEVLMVHLLQSCGVTLYSGAHYLGAEFSCTICPFQQLMYSARPAAFPMLPRARVSHLSCFPMSAAVSCYLGMFLRNVLQTARGLL